MRSPLSRITTYHPLWPVYLFINECLLGNTGQYRQYCSPKANSHAALSQPRPTRWSRLTFRAGVMQSNGKASRLEHAAQQARASC